MFAQVREDPLQDRALVRRLRDERGAGLRVLQVASGGCTAAVLACEEGVDELVLVDPNPAQLALARLKLRLLQVLEPGERLPLLGHQPWGPDARRLALQAHLRTLDLELGDLGPPDLVCELGPDQSGRYEQTFAALRRALDDQAEAVLALLQLDDPSQQASRVAAGAPLGDALQRAFAEVFALEPLVALFGEGATSNRVRPFDEHFLARTRDACAAFPAASNPYLWQVLAGRYPSDAVAPWLELTAETLPRVTCVNRFMNDALREVDGAFDLVHLSNILDWLSHDEAAETLRLATDRLRPGGRVVIRQLNSTVDVRGAGPGVTWEAGLSEALHAQDRSFFYRDLHVGRL
jgi:S-adenosylmethionine-diacylglycerol 3-amino-3-carboxypropyl transferase